MAENRDRDRISTRPQDWAPPARLHLFGAETLNDEELVAETQRLRILTSGGTNRASADARWIMAEREMDRRKMRS